MKLQQRHSPLRLYITAIIIRHIYEVRTQIYILLYLQIKVGLPIRSTESLVSVRHVAIVTVQHQHLAAEGGYRLPLDRKVQGQDN